MHLYITNTHFRIHCCETKLHCKTFLSRFFSMYFFLASYISVVCQSLLVLVSFWWSIKDLLSLSSFSYPLPAPTWTWSLSEGKFSSLLWSVIFLCIPCPSSVGNCVIYALSWRNLVCCFSTNKQKPSSHGWQRDPPVYPGEQSYFSRGVASGITLVFPTEKVFLQGWNGWNTLSRGLWVRLQRNPD